MDSDSPDLGLRVWRYLHSVWPRATTTTEEWLEDAKSLEESGEKQSWWADRRSLGSLDTWRGRESSFMLLTHSLLVQAAQLYSSATPGSVPGSSPWWCWCCCVCTVLCRDGHWTPLCRQSSPHMETKHCSRYDPLPADISTHSRPSVSVHYTLQGNNVIWL